MMKLAEQHIIDDAELLDAKLKEIQQKMDELDWLEKSFSRAFKGMNDDGLNYPEVYQGKGKDYCNVSPNDKYKSFSFIYVGQPQTMDGIQKHFFNMTAEISVIFFFNLNKIDPDIQYRFTELLKADVLAKLDEVAKLTVNQVFDEVLECYSEFSPETVKKEYLQKHFGALKFECTVRYSNDCKIINSFNLTE